MLSITAPRPCMGISIRCNTRMQARVHGGRNQRSHLSPTNHKIKKMQEGGKGKEEGKDAETAQCFPHVRSVIWGIAIWLYLRNRSSSKPANHGFDFFLFYFRKETSSQTASMSERLILSKRLALMAFSSTVKNQAGESRSFNL